jgi:prevent-host-death family protein
MDIRATSYSASEAKAHFAELLERAERGEHLTITRHGKAVARIIPIIDEEAVARRVQSAQDWIKYRDDHNITLGRDLTIKQLIDEGRK